LFFTQGLPGNIFRDLAACGGTFSTGLTELTRPPRLSESDPPAIARHERAGGGQAGTEHPVYPVQKKKIPIQSD
jgi:hypothetical protein